MDKETLEKHAGGFLDNLKGMDGSSITGLFDKLKEKGTDLKDHMPALEGLVKSGDSEEAKKGALDALEGLVNSGSDKAGELTGTLAELVGKDKDSDLGKKASDMMAKLQEGGKLKACPPHPPPPPPVQRHDLRLCTCTSLPLPKRWTTYRIAPRRRWGSLAASLAASSAPPPTTPAPTSTRPRSGRRTREAGLGGLTRGVWTWLGPLTSVYVADIRLTPAVPERSLGEELQTVRGCVGGASFVAPIDPRAESVARDARGVIAVNNSVGARDT